jgi:hypothetical protein
LAAASRSTKWAYPHAYGFEVGNKGQLARFRYVYIQAFSVASSGGAPRIKIDSEQSN